MFLTVVAALVFIEIVLIMIEYGSGQVMLGLFYRSVNFNIMDVTCCLVTIGMIYLFTPIEDLKQLYGVNCCLERLRRLKGRATSTHNNNTSSSIGNNNTIDNSSNNRELPLTTTTTTMSNL